MSIGSDGDDDAPIEIELEPTGPTAEHELDDNPPSATAAPPPAPREATLPVALDSVVEPVLEPGSEPTIEPAVRPPIDRAAAMARAARGDLASDLALYAAEAPASMEGARRATLLVEIGRLQEDVARDRAAALATAQAAFGADPSLLAAFWPLRRLLAAERRWDDLIAAMNAALATATLPPAYRADLLVERGRLLEDRLGRDKEATASYREALAADPDHAPALLSLYVAGARLGDGEGAAAALAGLARMATAPGRRVALMAAVASVQRRTGGPAGAPLTLATLDEALASMAGNATVSMLPLLRELDALARGPFDEELAAGALDRLARQAAPDDAPLAAALLREKARLRRADPQAVLAALEKAAQLAPDHPLVAAELVDVGERLGRPEVMAQAAAAFAKAVPADGARIADLALRCTEALARMGRHAEALAALEAGPATRETQALRTVLLARGGEAARLAEAFEVSATAAAGTSAAWALSFAAAIRQVVAGDQPGAEALYRSALEAAPGYRPAQDALEVLLRATGRGADVAALLELELARGDADPQRETWLREELVGIYRDDLGAPDRAVAHQRRLVELSPGDARRLVRLRDLELLIGAPTADTALALAGAAGEPAATAALQIEAARLAAAGDAESRRLAEKLLRQAIPSDATGLGPGALERILDEPAARAQVVADELAALGTGAPAEVVRALRFRLAYHQVGAGQLAEAIATLTPLRSEGDPLARAWSWELARQSGDAILEVAVLSEDAGSDHATVGAPSDVLVALAEALERAGDPSGAADAFRRASAPDIVAAPPPDAALGLLRLASAAPSPNPTALLDGLAAVAASAAAEPRFAEAARREAALVRLATGQAEAEDVMVAAPADGSPADAAEAAVLRWGAGVRRGDAGAVAGALMDMALALPAPAGEALGTAAPADRGPLLARAAARSRLAGAEMAEAVHLRAWPEARAAGLAVALSDLPVGAGAGWPEGRPDPRRTRASRTPGPLAQGLDLDAALDAERRGALGVALAGYARVLATAPERLEAWEGIRRVARAGGDGLGEARALARLATLIKTPSHAARLFSDAALLYEEAGRFDEAMALWAKALEARPDDEAAFDRLHELLLANPDAPGYTATMDRLLSHRLAALPAGAAARVPLLLERARHRAERLGDVAAAAQDFKRILNIDPGHEAALWEIGQLAMASGAYAAAAPFLERFVAASGEEEQAAAARLQLAVCYEATQERARAVDVLRRAAAARPDDPAPLQELVELYLRLGDWRGAVETLRAWEARLPDPEGRAALQLRVGELLRDHGYDPTGAALAFRTAAELDPLGDGTRALVALHDAVGDAAGARLTIEREIAQLRVALDTDPADPPRLQRLHAFVEALRPRRPSDSALDEALVAVTGVAAAVRGDATSLPDVQPAGAKARALAPSHAGAFWTQISHPGALGFMAEIWPHLVEAAQALFPAPPEAGAPRAARVAPGSEPGLAWVEASAGAIGLPALRLALASAQSLAAPVVPVLDSEPGLVVGPSVPGGGAGARFHVGRALALLRDRAIMLDWMNADDLASLFECAAVIAGVSPASGGAPPEAMLRTVNRVMSRKDKKALLLQASRFGFEPMDAAHWKRAVLRTADRLGLVLCGDVAVAARIARAGDTGGRVADLLRFALSETYPLLRREGGMTA
jgi:tetratricopeptide (TPR) repeat protein